MSVGAFCDPETPLHASHVDAPSHTTIKNTMQDYDVFVARKNCGSTQKPPRQTNGIFSVRVSHPARGFCSDSAHINTWDLDSSFSSSTQQLPYFLQNRLVFDLCRWRLLSSSKWRDVWCMWTLLSTSSIYQKQQRYVWCLRSRLGWDTIQSRQHDLNVSSEFAV